MGVAAREHNPSDSTIHLEATGNFCGRKRHALLFTEAPHQALRELRSASATFALGAAIWTIS